MQWNGANSPSPPQRAPLRSLMDMLQEKAEPYVTQYGENQLPGVGGRLYNSALQSGVEMSPGAGDLLGVEDLQTAAQNNDWAGIGLGMLAAIPGIPSLRGVRGEARAARQAVGAVADAVPAPRVAQTEAESALSRYRAANPEDTGARVLNPGDAGYPHNAQWDEASQAYVAPAEPAPTIRAYHGSPQAGLTSIRRGERGPFGPAAYLSPYDSVAKQYGENLYETDLTDVFDGIGRHPSSVNPYEVWRNQSARLIAASPSQSQAAIAELAAKMQPADGYAFFRRLSQTVGGDAAAQDLMRSAGFRGISGYVDGPEVAMFDDVPLASPEPDYPIRAYHGSPHSFDQFSLDKIGTGEGAQAYGHGLYFAESEDVARQYRNDLAGRSASVDGAKTYGSESPAHSILGAADWDIDRAIANAREHIDHFSNVDRSFSKRAGWEEVLAQLDDWKARGAVEANPGSMYEVGINAHPDTFLDWDRPLSEQPESVRTAYARAISRGDPLQSELLGDLSDPEAMRLAGLFPESRGAQAYNTLASVEGQRPWENFSKDTMDSRASDRLREHGINGIRYLDGNSRGVGEGSSNYVVFNDELVKILRKYGISGLGFGAGGTALADELDRRGQAQEF